MSVHRNVTEVPVDGRGATVDHQTVRRARRRPSRTGAGHADCGTRTRVPPRPDAFRRAGNVPAEPVPRATVVRVHAIRQRPAVLHR